MPNVLYVQAHSSKRGRPIGHEQEHQNHHRCGRTSRCPVGGLLHMVRMQEMTPSVILKPVLRAHVGMDQACAGLI